jgi:hypothetical protein
LLGEQHPRLAHRFDALFRIFDSFERDERVNLPRTEGSPHTFEERSFDDAELQPVRGVLHLRGLCTPPAVA